LSGGSYASFPVNVRAGQASITVLAGPLTVGADTPTAAFTSSSASSFNNALGTTSVTATAAVRPLRPLQRLAYFTQLADTAGRSGPSPCPLEISWCRSRLRPRAWSCFAPANGGGLKLSWFNYVRPALVQDEVSALGMNLIPNGLGLAGSLSVDGAIFYNLATLQTCTSTGVRVSQGSIGIYRATQTWDGVGWTMRLADGSEIRFPESYSASNLAQGAVDLVRNPAGPGLKLICAHRRNLQRRDAIARSTVVPQHHDPRPSCACYG
jgi:hypothetical protein